MTDGLPEGAIHLAGLIHDQTDLAPDTHADCPGRGVYFVSWDRLHPVHYCASPAEHGHTIRDLSGQSFSAAGATRPRQVLSLIRRLMALATRPEAGHRGQQGLEGRRRGAEAVAD